MFYPPYGPHPQAFLLHLNGKLDVPTVLPISLPMQSPTNPGGTSGIHQHLDKAVLSLLVSFWQLGLGYTTPGATQGAVVWDAGDSREG